MKKLKIISVVFGVIVLLLIVLGVLFSSLYEDKVKAYILAQINENVLTPIDIKEVEFSVFNKFPSASLEFKKVTATEVGNKKGTLFSAQSIYFQFNILDILNDNYTIKKISVEEGTVNINIDKKGKDNYHFWKTQKENKSNLSIALKKLTFKNITFYYNNEYKNMDMEIEAINLSLSGNFSKTDFTLTTKANLMVHQINDDGLSIIKNKKVSINTSLAVNQKTHNYQIKKGEIGIEALIFNLSGNLKNEEESFLLDITSSGKNLEIQELFSLFPARQQKVLAAYTTEGNITYSSMIKGNLSTTQSPSFDADFSINNGMITEKASDKSLTNLKVKGHYSNGLNNNSKTSQLTINELDADFGAGHISGDYTLSNFNNPYIKCNAIATVNLETAKEFFKLDTLEQVSGNLNLNINYQGQLKELNDIKAKDLQKLLASGTAQLENASFKLVNNPQTIKNINGGFQFDNNNIKVDSLALQINESRFELKGSFNNLLAYLFIKNEVLHVKTKLHTNKLVLEDFLIHTFPPKKTQYYTIALPKNIDFNFSATIDSFEFRKFRATDLSGNIRLEENLITATNVVFNAMEGKVTGNIALDDSHANEILITSKTQLHNINIKTLFTQFENFGQKHILAKNLKGTTTANIEFASVWDKNLKADLDKIYVLADLTIENGELNKYQPIYAMSKFIDVEELESIKFKELTTQIEIKDQTVFIPKTTIQSSAIDITLSGSHTFNNAIDYRFKLLMSDVIWGKAKRNKKENTEFGYIEDDGLGRTTLFLHMYGTVTDYKISYDTKGLKESFKEDLKEEKKTLKTILNKEFGWFKNDSTLKKEEKPDDGFEIEWEEAESDSTKSKPNITSKKKKKKKKKGLGKFLDNIAQPDADEYEENGEF